MLLLQRISISLALLVIIFTIFEIFLPIWRFLSRKTDAIMLYRVLKTNILEKKISLPDGHTIKISTSGSHYTLVFHNENEALAEIEKIVIDALTYFDKLGWIATVDNNFDTDKGELIEILYEIRTMKWNNSEK